MFFDQQLNADNVDLENIKKTLIIRQDNRVGNILFITSLIELIHKETNSGVDVIVGEKFHTLLDNNPGIDNVYVYRQREFLHCPWKFIGFLKTIKRTNYDLVIDCKDSFSFNNALLTLFSKSKVKIGFTNPLSDRYLNYSLEMKNSNLMHESIFLAQPFIHYFSLNCEVPMMNYALLDCPKENITGSCLSVVGIHIGGRKEKSISPDLVNHICSVLLENNIEVLVIYGPDEIDKVQRITNRKNITKIFPTSMEQLAQTINSTDVFISPDTGPLHIACALNKRIVAIFNSNNSKRYGPRCQQTSLTILTDELPHDKVIKTIKQFASSYTLETPRF